MTVQAEHLHLHEAHPHLARGWRHALARIAPSVLLAGYGLFILSLRLRGDLTLYINPIYVWPTTLAGAVLLILAAVRLLRPQASHCNTGDCGCASPPARLWPYATLSIPLLLALLVPPHSLAAFSARERGPQIAGLSVVNGASTVKHVSLSVDTRSLSLQDWAGVLSADPNPSDYAGKPVHITGMVLHSPAMTPPGTFMVIRYEVYCCIADARAIGLIVRDTSRGALQDNQWVTVTGTMGAVRYQGSKVAVVVPHSMVRVKAGNPYIY